MARRSTAPKASAKAEQAQSNTVLIVFVVISMLANVGLGIMWYLSQDEIVNAKKAKADADARANSADQKRKDLDQFIVTRLRQIIAGNVSDTDLSGMKESSTRMQQEPPEWWPALARQMEGDPNAATEAGKAGLVGPLDPGSGRLANNLAGRIKVLDQQVAQLRGQMKARDEELAKVNAEFKEYKAAWNETILAQKLNDAGRRSEADTREKLNQKDLVIKDLQTKISGLEKQVASMLEDQKNTFLAEAKKAADRFESTLAAKEKELQETRQLLDSRKQVQIDKPRGLVTKADPSGEIVYLNLGSDQKLTPGVTFSVHGKGPGGKPNLEPKARVEVISILGNGVSMARVRQLAKPEGSRQGLTSSDDGYWVNDPREFWRVRNPVLPGDLLYNPAWEPNREVHVALAGYFDIDGDGNDDLQAFINLLRAQGVVVDSYLDPADNFNPKGRLTSQTEYLLVGGVTTTMAGKIGDYQNEAAKKGIEVITLPRFLDRMGFSKDRLPVSRNANIKTATEAAAPADKPAEGNGKEPEKKEGNGEMKDGNGNGR